MRKSRFAAFYRTNLYLTDELRHYLAGSKKYGSDTPED
jgi:hypothetical protein